MDVDFWLNGICFRWDARKAASNLRRHSVAFESACEVFFDPFARFVHSEIVRNEVRETIMGLAIDWRLLVVVYKEREQSFRIISAREATRQEKKAYEDQ